MTDHKNAAAPAGPRSFLGKFTVLFGAVRELWIVFALTILGNLEDLHVGREDLVC